MKRYLLFVLLLLPFFIEVTPAGDPKKPEIADLIIHNAKVLTVDANFTIAEAIAVKNERIIAVGKNGDVKKHQGASTQLIDAKGKNILPGLYDSHTHPLGAATSEFDEELPYLTSLEDEFAYIRKKAKELPEGEWIVLRFAFPTRFKEARFPTLAELDAAAPKHRVLHNAGPASMVNSLALKAANVTKETKNPEFGVIVKDPKTGELTGMLRNATSVLGKIPAGKATAQDRRESVKKLFALYNSFGITSISDRNASRGAFDLYHDLLKKDELTLRINVCPSFSPYGTREEIAKRFDNLPGKDKKFGPTGAGGIWIRIGPIKFFLDGGMLNGTAYMRQPWPQGDTYQIYEKDYRGLLFTPPEQVKIVAEEAARRKWSVTAHTAGEGAMDVLLDGYEFVDRITPIKDLRFCITHANFPSQQNLERCKRLGVVADVQPAWLYKDGDTLNRVLGKDRIRWFQPYKSWLKYTTIGGGSDHMIKLDPRKATNPWDPWLGIEVAITRRLESGKVLMPEECLTREEALRLYTINNAFLGHEEKDKGTLEVGKLADFILIDRDYLTCPVADINSTRVLKTFVGGKVVYERKEKAPQAKLAGWMGVFPRLGNYDLKFGKPTVDKETYQQSASYTWMGGRAETIEVMLLRDAELAKRYTKEGVKKLPAQPKEVKVGEYVGWDSGEGRLVIVLGADRLMKLEAPTTWKYHKSDLAGFARRFPLEKCAKALENPPYTESRRTVEAFRHIHKGMSLSEVQAWVGAADKDIGSGIHILTYRLDDGSRVLIGFPDFNKLIYVRHEDKAGKVVDFAK